MDVKVNREREGKRKRGERERVRKREKERERERERERCSSSHHGVVLQPLVRLTIIYSNSHTQSCSQFTIVMNGRVKGYMNISTVDSTLLVHLCLRVFWLN